MAKQIADISALFNHANIQEYWKLENANANKNGNNLTNNNSVSFNSGRFNLGADFSSSNSNKSLSVASRFNYSGGAYSILLWFRQHSEITSGAYTLITVDDENSDTLFGLQYNYNGGSQTLQFLRDKSGVAAEGVTVSVKLGTGWHGLAMTYDGSNVRGYIDGKLVGGPSSASGTGTNAVTSQTGIGFKVRDSSQYTSGLIDDLALFNTEITAALIAEAHSPDGGAFLYNMI